MIAIAPGGFASGGPEAQHQLVDSINRQGGSARVLYWPPRDDWTTSGAYVHYLCPIATMASARTARYVVLAEVDTALAKEFDGPEICQSWLSVDNLLVAHRPGRLGRQLLRLGRRSLHTPLARIWLKRYLSHIDHHLSQSTYATEFLTSRGIHSTYIGDHVVIADEPRPAGPRPGGIITNGLKGTELRERFEALNPQIPLRALRRMSAHDVAIAMRAADIYIDFGDHPGKDRMPREAAASGCVVLVHRAGAAVNAVDVPIAERFKFDGTDEDLRRIGGLLAELLADPAPAFEQQAHYRETIAAERVEFDRDVAGFFGL